MPTPRMLTLMAMLALLTALSPAGEANNPALISGTLTVPKRIGITTPRFDRHLQGKATVAPAGEAAKSDVTTDSDRIKLENIVKGDGTITFDVVGAKESAAEDDVVIKLTHPSGTLATAKLSVIVPKKIGTPHPEFDGTVNPSRSLLNSSTSPAAPGVAPPKVMGFNSVLKFLTIPVVDQFGKKCGDLYAGSAITEGGVAINQTLTGGSAYQDPVGFGTAGPTFDNANVQAAKDFLAGAPTAVPDSSTTQNIPVEVDGFSLTDGVKNRKVELKDGNKLKITWP